MTDTEQQYSSRLYMLIVRALKFYNTAIIKQLAYCGPHELLLSHTVHLKQSCTKQRVKDT